MSNLLNLNNTMKKMLVFLFAIAIAFSIPLNVLAHDAQSDHDDDLQDVLFGDSYKLTGTNSEKFQAIANAAALCIDQYSVNEKIKSKKELFTSLDKRISFSFKFEDIELQKMPNGKSVTAKTHRSFTHRGWNFTEYPLKKLWNKRKKILTATVNKELFNQSTGIVSHIPIAESLFSNEAACNEKCESFCELVYYVHILGDYEEATSYSDEFKQLIPLVRHEDPNSPALIDEIIRATEVLFRDQEWVYPGFKSDLEIIKNRAEKVASSKGGLDNQVHFDAYCKCANDVMSLLVNQIPGMLKKTDFFHDAFYE